jgi:hypothetical protein
MTNWKKPSLFDKLFLKLLGPSAMTFSYGPENQVEASCSRFRLWGFIWASESTFFEPTYLTRTVVFKIRSRRFCFTKSVVWSASGIKVYRSFSV